jgi:2-polyprenyl-6-methoxyphenol hydroxylase-like FAD-dependent oxidoreductase
VPRGVSRRSSLGGVRGTPRDVVDVAVVGMGPVGSALALLLARRGRTVTILERQPHPYGRPRAVHIDASAARVLQRCGIGDQLATHSHATSVYEWRNAEGVLLLRLQSAPSTDEGWPTSNMVHQPDIERALAAEIERHELISVEVGRRVVAVEQSDDAAVVHAVDDAGAREQHCARYVVGCDGANSVVRSIIDAPVEDLGFFFDWLILDVVLNEPRVFEPENLQICDPARPTTVVSGGPGRRRWEFMCLPGEDPQQMNEVARAWELLAPWDVRQDNATLERHAVYRFQALWATRWRRDRTLIAGDAAHLMPPFAGQGLCSGLRDAGNLAWKLDLALTRPERSDAILDSYQSEREPHVRASIELSVELGKIICVPDPVAAAERDAAMAPAAAHGAATAPAPPPPLVDGMIAQGMPAAGRTFPQASGVLDGVQLRSDDVQAGRWWLVTRGDRVADAPAWFSAIGATVDRTSLGPLAEPLERWLSDHGLDAALVRPDGIVYGGAAGPDDLDALIASLGDRLALE